MPYHAVVFQMMQRFENFHNEHIPRSQNSYDDALALFITLALQSGSSDEILIFAHDIIYLRSATKEIPTPTKDFQGQVVLEISEASKLRDW